MTTARWEVTAVLLTGLGNALLADWLGWRLAFIAGACLFWTVFVVVRAARNSSVLAQWGFTTRGFGRSVRLLLPALVVSVVGFATFGLLNDRLIMNSHLFLICLLYPIWGLVQQFLVVALVADNIKKHIRLPDPAIVCLTARAFAAVHTPSPPLVVASFVLTLITTSVFFRNRNLYALGLFHGLFATGLYYFALGQDLWKEVIGAPLWP